ncbi:MAG TPA: DUF4383 domain-containing protein [Xanthobacteraceae bacterium]|nr:DUF4383 domain-containing protein [Xanthobacteraceae bacterium]
MNLNAKTAAIVIGVVFILVGILGFIDNPLVSATGLFAVNTVHNLVHIVSGLVLLAGAYSFGSSLALKIVGVVYGIVAILGLITSSDMLLGTILVNQADDWLHVLLAVVILAAGFLLEDEPAMA